LFVTTVAKIWRERLGCLKSDTAEGQEPHPTFPDDAEPPEDETTLRTLQQAAITCRIALGPHASQNTFTLQTLPPSFADKGPELATAHGFSLHAGVACSPAERDILQRLTRYIARPALAGACSPSPRPAPENFPEPLA
jgi:hypothetical protein